MLHEIELLSLSFPFSPIVSSLYFPSLIFMSISPICCPLMPAIERTGLLPSEEDHIVLACRARNDMDLKLGRLTLELPAMLNRLVLSTRFFSVATHSFL